MSLLPCFVLSVISCDYQYWKQKGWLDEDYYYDTVISLFKNCYVKLIENRMKRRMSKKYKQRSGR